MENAAGLTPWLLEKLQNGEAMLFLGSGAVYGAKGPSGEVPLNGNQLRDRLADKFLGGAHKDRPLTRVADYAKNESSLDDVQSYIRSLLLPLQPASFHEIIPRFRWFAIVTTNYDLVIERAYARVGAPLQHLRPILRDGDQFSDVLRDSTAVPFLKLHGCITTLNDHTLPLILSSEEYAKHKTNRARLFRHFADWARERPVVFAGYDISDPNIQQILFDLSDMGIHRPTYAVVTPSLDDIETRYWQARRFVPVRKTFDAFLTALDREVPANNRILAALKSPYALSFQRWVSTQLKPSERLVAYLAEEITHVRPGMSTTGADPKSFFQGKTLNWAVFEQELDVRRRVSDDVILDAVLPENLPPRCHVYLVKGHAGAGISVLLRRVAWDAAKHFDALVFALNEGGVLRPDLILELAQLTRTKLVLIVDDVLQHAPDMQQLVQLAEKNSLAISLIIGARTNEWNVAGQNLDPLIKEDYELRDLGEREVQELLGKLERYDSLGELEYLNPEQRIERFQLHAERQLLIALHEATTGKPFEEIVFDEYEHVIPHEARILYLDICTLHRLGVPVRAGLVSRISGITFDYFRRELFAPLEHVVRTFFDAASRDYVYRTRHPLIAEFVFAQALPDPIERVAQIKRIIRHMDVDYESDAEAFRQLVKGKTLADLFADKTLAWEIFDAAIESGASRSFVLHQKAVFELNHPGGNMRYALDVVTEAESLLQQPDRSIQHTKAVIFRRLALESERSLERAHLRNEARQLLRKLQPNARTPHAINTYAQLLLDEIGERLSDWSDKTAGTSGELEERAIADLIRQTEEALFNGLQQFPSDEYLLALDAKLAALLRDEPRAITSLQKAFLAHPARAFVAVRLARIQAAADRMDEARATLETCLAANPSSKEAHLELAKLYMADGEQGRKEEIGYHLKRSFTEGDSNFAAQALWARHEFLYGIRNAGLEMFRKLSDARTSSADKKRVQGIVTDDERRPLRYSGYVRSVHNGYCFASCPDLSCDIFLSRRALKEADWENVRQGSHVDFLLGFSMRGPQGVHARLN